ncbi:unnamed protein product [Pleuronectes platessa]|uniref:Uncharacterized protein n=1 Tax=Pleuronectes platessa TaxID=8262 RepID=A0A9N7Z2Y2_PLEPL|nr:unnamed protein product [Pleuronectes platessa]
MAKLSEDNRHSSYLSTLQAGGVLPLWPSGSILYEQRGDVWQTLFPSEAPLPLTNPLMASRDLTRSLLSEPLSATSLITEEKMKALWTSSYINMRHHAPSLLPFPPLAYS